MLYTARALKDWKAKVFQLATLAEESGEDMTNVRYTRLDWKSDIECEKRERGKSRGKTAVFE